MLLYNRSEQLRSVSTGAETARIQVPTLPSEEVGDIIVFDDYALFEESVLGEGQCFYAHPDTASWGVDDALGNLVMKLVRTSAFPQPLPPRLIPSTTKS